MSVPRPFDARTVRSGFGGGWIIPLTPAGTQSLMEFFGEEPAEIPVLIGEGGFPFGYIVEPWQGMDLIEFLKDSGLSVESEI